MTARENPFATSRLERVRYRADGFSVEQLLERFAAMGRRAAIAGPEGSGKTALLAELGEGLRRQGFKVVHLRAGQGLPARLAPGEREVVLLDEADVLGPPAWRRFLRQTRGAGGLLIATHRARRLPLLWRCETSAALLDEIAAELSGGAQCTAGLFERHGGNIRSALLELYDRFAGRTGRYNSPQ
jgi:hypothetical protein